jgi:hypothetical protein
MVVVRVLGPFVFSKTFMFFVIIFVNLFPLPVLMAFYAEMVVATHRQAAVTAPRFEYPLSQSYGSRYFKLLHLPYGDVFVLLDVLLGGHVLLLAKSRKNNNSQEEKKYKKPVCHNMEINKSKVKHRLQAMA